MKLSEAIRLGAMLRMQAFGDFTDGIGSCAWGAANEASGRDIDDEDIGDELGIAAMDAGTVGEDWSPAEVMAHPVTRAAVTAALQAASWKLTSTPDWFVDATLANLVDTFVDRLRLSRAQATALLAGVAAARRHAVHDVVREAAE